MNVLRLILRHPYLWPALLPGWPRPYGPAQPRRVFTVSLPNILGDSSPD